MEIPPQFHLRLPKKKWGGIPNPLSALPEPRPFFRPELRTVVVALRPDAALGGPCPIRPHLILYIAFPNFAVDTEVMIPKRSPRKRRPRLKPVSMRQTYRHSADPASRRPALQDKLSRNPKRARVPLARMANFALLPLSVSPSALRATAPRRLLRGTMIGPNDGVGNGKCFFF